MGRDPLRTNKLPTSDESAPHRAQMPRSNRARESAKESGDRIRDTTCRHPAGEQEGVRTDVLVAQQTPCHGPPHLSSPIPSECVRHHALLFGILNATIHGAVSGAVYRHRTGTGFLPSQYRPRANVSVTTLRGPVLAPGCHPVPPPVPDARRNPFPSDFARIASLACHAGSCVFGRRCGKRCRYICLRSPFESRARFVSWWQGTSMEGEGSCRDKRTRSEQPSSAPDVIVERLGRSTGHGRTYPPLARVRPTRLATAYPGPFLVRWEREFGNRSIPDGGCAGIGHGVVARG